MPGLEDLYREIILDHYRTPRNRGELAPPAVRAEGHNPLCGDEIQVYLDVDGDVVKDIKVNGQGCSISQSSASMMSQAVADQLTTRGSSSSVPASAATGQIATAATRLAAASTSSGERRARISLLTTV